MESNSLYQPKLLNGPYHIKLESYYDRQFHGYSMPFHLQNSMKIMYVMNGECCVEFLQNTIQMKQGNFILIDANMEHRLLVEEGRSCRMLNIEFVFINQQGVFPSLGALAKENRSLFQLLTLRRAYLVLHDQDEVYPIMQNIILLMDEQKLEEVHLMVQMQMSMLLIQIAQRMEATNEHEDRGPGLYVEKAIAFMNQQYDRDIRIKDIADAVFVHEGYLHRIFKKSKGCTVLAYLTALRMERAKLLLSRTNIPVADICEHVGINSSPYFSCLFKKHTGRTPSEFRRASAESIEREKLEIYK